MASYQKFQQFVEDIAEKKHDLGTDALKILLTNTAVNVADTVVDTVETPCVVKATSNAVEIAAASGYAKGGPTAALTSSSQTAGTYKLVLQDVVITAAATIGPFRYVVLYNSAGGAAATRPVIGYFDYGQSITLNSGDTYTLDFSAEDGVIQIS